VPPHDDEQRPTLVQSPARFLPQASPSTHPAIDRRDAVRVVLQEVDGKPGVYLARAMRPGDKPGPGTRAALLIALDDEPLF
jgi:hypothetical protein